MKANEQKRKKNLVAFEKRRLTFAKVLKRVNERSAVSEPDRPPQLVLELRVSDETLHIQPKFVDLLRVHGGGTLDLTLQFFRPRLALVQHRN